MEAKRFIIIVSVITVLFTALMVIYNFSSEPPFGPAKAVIAASENFDNLFVADSSSSAAASAPQSSRQILSSSAYVSAIVTDNSKPQSAASSHSTAVSKSTVNYPVNINTATKEQLMTLPGIGEVLAQRIIDYRNQNGKFTSINELNNVKGIGEKTFAKIKNDVTVN